MFDAHAVKYGWKSSDAHVIDVSPLKPTGYRCEPGPAYREKVNGRTSRPERRPAESRKWKWLSIHNGSIPGTRECGPDCQSSHQKSTPSDSRRRCRMSKYAMRNCSSVTSKAIGSSFDVSRPRTAAISGYASSNARTPSAG